MKPRLLFLLLSLVITVVSLHAQDTLKRVVRVVDFGTDSTKKPDTLRATHTKSSGGRMTDHTAVQSFGIVSDIYLIDAYVYTGYGFLDYSGLNGTIGGLFNRYRPFRQIAEHWSVGGSMGASIGINEDLIALKFPLALELRGGNGSSDEEDTDVNFGIGAGLVPGYLYVNVGYNDKFFYASPLIVGHVGFLDGALRVEYAPRQILTHPASQSTAHYSSLLLGVVFYFN